MFGIYSSSNPFIAEFELESFSVVKYIDIPDGSSGSCLICFDSHENDDGIRKLFRKHFYRKNVWISGCVNSHLDVLIVDTLTNIVRKYKYYNK